MNTNKPMTATEVELSMKLYNKKLKIMQYNCQRLLNKICLKPLMKRTLITLSNHGSITSAVCMKIEVTQ